MFKLLNSRIQNAINSSVQKLLNSRIQSINTRILLHNAQEYKSINSRILAFKHKNTKV